MAIPFCRSLRSLESERFAGRPWLLLGTGLLVAWLVWSLEAQIPVYEMSESARIEVSGAAYEVEASASGRVAAVHLVLGGAVRTNDVLVELESQLLQLQAEEAASRSSSLGIQLQTVAAEISSYERALARAGQAQAYGFEEARAALAEARATSVRVLRDLRRVEALHAQQLRSDTDLDGAEAEVEQAMAVVEQRRAALGSREQKHLLELEERRGELQASRRERQQLEAEREAVGAEIERIALELDRRLIRSPVDGTLGEVADLQPGTYVAAGESICTLIPEHGEARVVAGFSPHRALGRVRSGQRARILLDGFPWPEHGFLFATVKSVASEPTDSLLRVELALHPGSTIRQLQHGLRGRVEVEVERRAPFSLLLQALGRSVDRPISVSRVARVDRAAP